MPAAREKLNSGSRDGWFRYPTLVVDEGLFPFDSDVRRHSSISVQVGDIDRKLTRLPRFDRFSSNFRPKRLRKLLVHHERLLFGGV